MISRLLSNIYLTEVDAMLERAQAVTADGAHTYVEYARYADDLVVLVNNDRRQDWLVEAVHQRLRGELAKLDVQLNEEKSRIVDLSRGESFGFLGFDFRRGRSLRGRGRAQYTPKRQKRVALLQELKEVFRRYQSQPTEELIAAINPKLRHRRVPGADPEPRRQGDWRRLKGARDGQATRGADWRGRVRRPANVQGTEPALGAGADRRPCHDSGR